MAERRGRIVGCVSSCQKEGGGPGGASVRSIPALTMPRIMRDSGPIRFKLEKK